MSEHGHHIISYKSCLRVWGSLLLLTVITVATAKIDLGFLNFSIAMLIATVKALVVVFFFMGLKYDSNENRAIFFSSFIFLFIFVFLTFSDLLFRPKIVSKLIQEPAVTAITQPAPAVQEPK